MVDPIRKLSSVYSKIKRSTAAAERVFEMLDHQSLVQETSDPQLMPRLKTSVEFRQIEFAYAARDANGNPIKQQNVLDNVDLTIQAGEVIVVVGENGSGKSTLVNLLPRFYDPTHGTILIDGVEIQNVKLSDLRKEVGVVAQETLLFDDTIFNNIRYGKPIATREEVQEAATQAHVTAFLENKERFPKGLQTNVGERGGELSGGQRQRIALARAILCDPSILILDEATSAIDAKSEQLIYETLASFVKGRTTFMITHSVNQSILNFSPRILVMDRGRLIASGTHSELSSSCPIYQRLFQLQTEQQTVHASDESKRDEFPEPLFDSSNHSPTIISFDDARKQKDEGVA
ncbi:Lipid A export ATP-binding/permease protein MsbA [hydrothermal vent metagenome]|uniref:Lipid A export ATP-binding/permease protein MsbA n=1 Tax=hydrothermal vent metagenome TaxID=652676 RepID=A0A3B1DK58_9ZZZZ